MDNVIQNIKLDDILPSDFQSYDPETTNLSELVASIKKYGLIEPLLVRPQNGKYEIILGNKRYRAALQAGLTSVPALVKNVDDEVVRQYRIINHLDNNRKSESTFSTPNSNDSMQSKNTFIKKEVPPQEAQQMNKSMYSTNPTLDNFNPMNRLNHNTNMDVINLSELNKKEYERDDVPMNNEQMNNNLGTINSNQAQALNNKPANEPTFGGRFFPSLEDEPTNMDIGGMNSFTAPIAGNINPTPTSVPNTLNNNLIDLTDIAAEKENPMQTPPTFANIPSPEQTHEMIPNNQVLNNQPTMNQNNITPINDNPYSQPTSAIPNSMVNPMDYPSNNSINSPIMDPTINQLNNNTPSPVSNFQNSEPINNVPQFDMSQNIAPTNFSQPQSMNGIGMDPATNFNSSPTPAMPTNPVGIPALNNEFLNEPSSNTNVNSSPIAPAIPPEEMQTFPQKEVFPVVNTIKSVAASLETFGYKINMVDEDGPNSYKIIIEIEK